MARYVLEPTKKPRFVLEPAGIKAETFQDAVQIARKRESEARTAIAEERAKAAQPKFTKQPLRYLRQPVRTTAQDFPVTLPRGVAGIVGDPTQRAVVPGFILGSPGQALASPASGVIAQEVLRRVGTRLAAAPQFAHPLAESVAGVARRAGERILAPPRAVTPVAPAVPTPVPAVEAAPYARVTSLEPLEVRLYPPSAPHLSQVYRGKTALEVGQREGILTSTEQMQAMKDLAISAGWSERRLRTFIRVETGRRGKPLSVFEAQKKPALEAQGVKVGPAPEPVAAKVLDLPAMTREEGDRVLSSLTRYVQSGEVGLKEQFRPVWRVIEEKIGLGEEVYQPISRAAFRIADEERQLFTQFAQWQKVAGKGKTESGILFRLADDTLTELDRVWLQGNPVQAEAMREVVEQWRQLASKAADELGLPPAARIENYITHLFERSLVKSLKDKHPIPDEIQAVLHYAAPTKIRNPFLEQRTGRSVGLKEDFWGAVSAWGRYYLRSKHYTAALQEVAPRVQFLKPQAQSYVKDWLAYRVAGRPHPIDKQLSRTISETVEGLTLGRVKPNPIRAATEASNLLTNASYKGALLGNLHFWFMNAAQPFLTVADKGLIASGRGAVKMFTPQGRNLLNEFPSIRSMVPTEFLTGQSARRILETPGLTPTRLIEFVNRSHAALTGYTEAIKRGVSHADAIKAGEDLIRRTQFSYREIDLPLVTASAIGKPLGQFKTWGINFLELLKDWSSIRSNPQNAAKLARFVLYGYLADVAFKEVGLDLSRAFNPGVMLKDAATGFRVTMPAAWQFIVGLAETSLGSVSGDERLQRQGLNDLKRGATVLVPYGVQIRRLFRLLAGEDDLIQFFAPTVKEKP